MTLPTAADGGRSIPPDLGQSWIDGQTWTKASGRMEHYNPFDGTSLGSSETVDAAAVAAAVSAARRCYEYHWGKWNHRQRAALLMKFADLIGDNAEQLALTEALEVGRPLRGARQMIRSAPDFVRGYLGLSEGIVGDVFAAEDRRLGVVWRRPRGVIAAIIPWNVPVMNFLVRVVPALVAGNTVVVKPSEYSPRSAVLLAKIASQAGLPDGALNVVLGSGAVAGEALAAHSDVNLVAFTGSSATGRAVARSASSSTSKPVLLECGGKSAQIVLDDAFDDAGIWSLIFHSSFWNSGQWCVAKTRLLVPRLRMQDALSMLQLAAAQWRLGKPLDEDTTLGPLANSTQLERVRAYFDIARREGTLVELDCARGNVNAAGCFVVPSVAMDLPRTSPVVQQEVFGPLLSLEPFEDVEDAIASANCTEYGLQGSIWTKRSDLGYRLARSIAAGSVTVFSSSAAAAQATVDLTSRRFYEPQKQSGHGIDGGLQGLLAYTCAQAITFMN